MMHQPTRQAILLIAFFFSFALLAQESSKKPQKFVRVYNLEGKKIYKGRVVEVSDSHLTLSRGKENKEINIEEVGYLKTRHSTGHNVLWGAAASSALFATAFAVESDPSAWIFGYSVTEGIVSGIVFGAPLGAGVGALSSLLKRQVRIDISGDTDKWLLVKDSLLHQ